jgi:chitin disaccharide deacetylase
MARMAPTLAERLGFSVSDRVAVVHADDIGMCHAANEGAFAALERGAVTCGSIMVPCPWFREAAERARANSKLDLGIHLTLNSEWPHYRWGPVAGRGRVPSLLDDQGFLPRTALETVKRARPEEVEVELRAQIEMALAAGIDVTHFDSHMGTVFFPPFVDLYVKLAREYRIPVFAVRPEKRALERAGLAAAEPILRRVAEALEAAGFPLLDAVDADSLDFTPGEGEAHTAMRLERLGRGVSYWIIHPAKDGEELRAISPDAHARAFEHGFYGGSAGRAAFERAGVKTVGMRALRQLMP